MFPATGPATRSSTGVVRRKALVPYGNTCYSLVFGHALSLQSRSVYMYPLIDDGFGIHYNVGRTIFYLSCTVYFYCRVPHAWPTWSARSLLWELYSVTRTRS